MTKVAVDNLSEEIMKTLEEQAEQAVETINEQVDAIADEAISELKRTSPRSKGSGGRRGHYADGWTKQLEGSNWKGITRKIIHNKAKPQITHLLENGHLIAGGTRRVPGKSHITPVFEKIMQKLKQLGG